MWRFTKVISLSGLVIFSSSSISKASFSRILAGLGWKRHRESLKNDGENVLDMSFSEGRWADIPGGVIKIEQRIGILEMYPA